MPHAFIVDAIRTSFGRYGGALSTVGTDDLGAVQAEWLCRDVTLTRVSPAWSLPALGARRRVIRS
ncbi:MAG: hypothetical protein ABI343_09495 [Burkholderiaceae bacterium]